MTPRHLLEAAATPFPEVALQVATLALLIAAIAAGGALGDALYARWRRGPDRADKMALAAADAAAFARQRRRRG